MIDLNKKTLGFGLMAVAAIVFFVSLINIPKANLIGIALSALVGFVGWSFYKKKGI